MCSKMTMPTYLECECPAAPLTPHTRRYLQRGQCHDGCTVSQDCTASSCPFCIGQARYARCVNAAEWVGSHKQLFQPAAGLGATIRGPPYSNFRDRTSPLSPHPLFRAIPASPSYPGCPVILVLLPYVLQGPHWRPFIHSECLSRPDPKGLVSMHGEKLTWPSAASAAGRAAFPARPLPTAAATAPCASTQLRSASISASPPVATIPAGLSAPVSTHPSCQALVLHAT